MRFEDGLVVFLALAAGGMLLAGLAQALDARPRAPRPRRWRELDAIEATPPAADSGAVASIDAPAELEPRAGQRRVEIDREAIDVATAPPAAEVSGADAPNVEALATDATPAQLSAVDVRSSTGVHEDGGDVPSAALAPGPTLSLAWREPPEADPAEASASSRPTPSLHAPLDPVEAAPDPHVLTGPVSSTTAAKTPEPPANGIAIAPAPAAARAKRRVVSKERQVVPEPPVVSKERQVVPEPPVALEQRVVEDPNSAPAQIVQTPAAPVDIAGCLRAYEAGDYTAVECAARALARPRSAGTRAKRGDAGAAPIEQVALWSALALSRRNRGDEEGAASAFEAGARWAAAVSHRRVPASVDGLAPRLGRHLLTVGEAMREGVDARRSVLRVAATWLGANAAGALAVRAGDGFAAEVTSEVKDHIARRGFAAAHGAIEDALGGIAVPDGRRDDLRDLLWTSLTGEIGRLVGHALHGAGGPASAAGTDGDGAMATLAAAAAVLAEVPPGALSPERHHDLAGRLWWAHMQLGGERRVRGELDAAVAPLLHALALAAGDSERDGEAREAVALVIEAFAERLGHEIRDRLRAADLDGAMAASRRLGEVVDDALSRGLSPADLAGALARRQEVLLELAEGRPA